MKSEIGLEIIAGKQFANERVVVDGKEFRQCKFEGCVLAYEGGEPWLFDGCDVANSPFRFDGAAEATLYALRVAYASGQRKWIEAVFDTIRNPVYVQPN